MKKVLKELTSRSNGWSYEYRKLRLRRFIIGWVNYFKLASMVRALEDTDMWYRRRLRMVIWKQWKTIRNRARNLAKLGLSRSQAWYYANTRKSYWHTAYSPILTRTITNEALKSAGYLFLLDYYRNVRT